MNSAFFSLPGCRGAFLYLVLGLSVVTAGEPLDKKRVHDLYLEGEFEKVTIMLEDFRKTNPNPSKDDKIFIYKHLSVVYAANPETRDKGEVYMFQLLKILPTAELLDMYISETIQLIFANVKKDFKARGKYTSVQGYEEKQQDPSLSQEQKNKNQGNKNNNKGYASRKWIWWTAGGLAVASGVTLFLMLGSEQQASPPMVGPNHE